MRAATRILLTASLLVLLAAPALPVKNAQGAMAIYYVTNTLDSGTGSLRWAIDQANANPGQDTISFKIPIADPGYVEDYYWRIGLQTALPTLTDLSGVIIDGRTQSEFSGIPYVYFPPIYLDSVAVVAGLPVLYLTGNYNTIAGLFLANSNGDAITVLGDHNIIDENRVGTTKAIGINLVSGSQYNQVSRNTIYDSLVHGVRLTNSHMNILIDNIIGLVTDGRTPWGNTLDGLALYNSQDNDILQNTISANGGSGILVSGGSNNRVEQNFIGLSADLRLDLGNAQHGIWLQDNSINNRLFENWIAGNGADGIRLSGANTYGNKMEKNNIGFGWEGAVPNGQHGIGIYDGAHNNTVGSNDTDNRENFVAANGWSGVVVVDSPIGQNHILDNFIVNNGFYGVHIKNSPENKIYRNIISGNGMTAVSAGVRVEGSASLFNTILENSISHNSGLGIQLADNANAAIPQPHVTAASCSKVTIYAAVGSIVQIFSDRENEGEVYEGWHLMTADSYEWFGRVTRPFVTVTQTDVTGNTSIFSEALFACGTTYLPVVLK